MTGTDNTESDDLEAKFHQLMDDLQVIYSAKAGQVLTQADVDALNRVDQHYRDNEEAATDAFTKGREDGIAHAGGTTFAKQAVKLDTLRCELAVAKGLRKFADNDREKLQAILSAFVAHYPVGTNPFLDDAYKQARSYIAKNMGEQSHD